MLFKLAVMLLSSYDSFICIVDKKRLEGKTYIVHDGDIINFRFNV
jgi:ribosome-binding ATPase YchF (GTP1/OBG family)